MVLLHRLAVGLAVVPLLAGCVRPRPVGLTADTTQLRRRALECLEAATHFQHNPAVRVGAVEALESSQCREGLPWIRAALLDEHPAVRFAGCLAAGRLRDSMASTAVHRLLEDEDASVRVGALYARHRLGHSEDTGKLATYLLHHDDPAVRRNAALALGLTEEPAAVKVLARAMKDRDAGVRQHALEAMARLGNPDAKQELVFMTAAGIGSEEVFAIGALAATRDPALVDTFLHKLESATHLETRLTAARGLGLLGSAEGLQLALDALGSRTHTIDDPSDSPAARTLRIRQLAASALGAIGHVGALPILEKTMNDRSDPRIQVSAAKAILEVLEANRSEVLPFGATVRKKR